MSYKNTNFEQFGRSMVEMLGVLAIIGVLSVGGIAGYSKAMDKYKLSKTKDIIINTLTKYSDLTSRKVGSLTIKGANSQELAINANLIDECDLQESAVPGASSYKVCKLPLGEHFIKVEAVKDNIYSYMYFISFAPANKDACVDILSAGWQSSLPEEWWKTGRLWVAPYAYAHNNYGAYVHAYSIYGSQGVFERKDNSWSIVPVSYIKTINAQKIAGACYHACKKENKYCTIAFDFIGYN